MRGNQRAALDKLCTFLSCSTTELRRHLMDTYLRLLLMYVWSHRMYEYIRPRVVLGPCGSNRASVPPNTGHLS